jgi:Ser/Thr protein kinase RdoA (MazF antagonist)
VALEAEAIRDYTTAARHLAAAGVPVFVPHTSGREN